MVLKSMKVFETINIFYFFNIWETWSEKEPELELLLEPELTFLTSWRGNRTKMYRFRNTGNFISLKHKLYLRVKLPLHQYRCLLTWLLLRADHDVNDYKGYDYFWKVEFIED
jgi:hypothetical protein